MDNVKYVAKMWKIKDLKLFIYISCKQSLIYTYTIKSIKKKKNDVASQTFTCRYKGMAEPRNLCVSFSLLPSFLLYFESLQL